MKRVRPIAEPEVIAEFLRNEFYAEDFHRDRERFRHLVLQPDFSNERENAVRRALLFRRRGHMWRELPPDTAWWEVQFDPEDVSRLRVLSRSHWRAIAGGDFRLSTVVERVRSGRFPAKVRDFIAKIHALSRRLGETDDSSAILLIGVDERRPLVILEGNHRLTAAVLADPALLYSRFRVLCGFSPNMTRSCWYQNTIPNLLRYLRNRLANVHDKASDLSRLLPSDGTSSNATAAAAAEPEMVTDSNQRQFSPGG